MKISDEEIRRVIAVSTNMSEAARCLNMNFFALRYRAKKLGIYKPNQGRSGITRLKHEYRDKIFSLDKILNGEYPNYQTVKLKKRLINEGIKDEVCEECGQGILWNNKKLVLQLDHKDGNSRNHKLENLKLLCPNCHSQTNTFAGRNNKRFSDLELQERKKIRDKNRYKK